MSKKRRQFSKEFKEHAVNLVVEEGRKSSEVAKELGISVNTIYAWKSQYLGLVEEANNPETIPQLQSRNLELEKRVKQLEEETAILKKAAIYFAQDP